MMKDSVTKVLVIEDNPGDADLIRALLSEATLGRFDVEVENRLSGGLQRLSVDQVNVLLLDLSLPDSFGLETLHKVQQKAPAVPIVVLTGSDDEDLAIRALKEGAQDYLVKGTVDANVLARAALYAVERARAQESLREAHRLTQQIVDIFYIFDAKERRIVYGSPRFATLLGLEPDGFQRTRPSLAEDLLHAEDRCGLDRRLKRFGSIAESESIESQFRIKVASGQWRWLAARETVFTRSPEGMPLLILGTAHDVSRQRQLEEELRNRDTTAEKPNGQPSARLGGESEMYRDLYDHAPDMMALIDMVEGKVVECNQTFADAVGQRKEEIVGRPYVELYHPGCRESAQQAFVEFAKTGTVVERERVFPRADGTVIEALQKATPVFDPNGRLVASRSTWRDITERKRAEQALRRQAQELARSNAELADFAYIASHDLKEPLRGIQNYACFLMEDYGEKLNEEARSRVETIVRLTKRLETLVDTLLHYSRVGRVDLAVTQTNLQEVLEAVLDSLQVSLQEAQVEVRVSRPLPTVRCDQARVAEVFHNLVTNAIKYNNKPQKWIEIGCGPDPRRNGQRSAREASGGRSPLVFFVRDNGIGIPEKHLGSIFRIFKRLHGRDKYGGGTGAGLTVVKKVVERHGGDIWVESTVNEGTTFYFTLEEA